MIIVSITGPSIDKAMRQIVQSSVYADMFEFRLDMIRKPAASLFALTRKPFIATCRPEWEGGNFSGAESKRITLIESAVEAGASYIDVEWKAGEQFLNHARRVAPRIIISHHAYANRRIDVRKLYNAMKATGADVLKFACVAHDAADMRYVIEFLLSAARDKQKAVAIAMGEYGEASRVLYKKFGGWATYASPESSSISAPGQINAQELKSLYNVDKINRRTKVFGVVGNPLHQSKGIFLHNPLFRRAKKNAVYCRFPVKNLLTFMQHIAPMLDGFSVTIPHKEKILTYIDKPDATAKAIGAVNTVLRRKTKLIATNTDAAGALNAIETVITVRGKTMLVLGAGGAARAIAYEARERGAEVFIANRNEAKGRKLARDLGLELVKQNRVHALHFAIIANATSVGMTPHVNESPLPSSALNGAVVFDAVYNPPMTKLLRDAQRTGCKIIQGTQMYLNQAGLQSQLYSGRKPATSVMKRILSLR